MLHPNFMRKRGENNLHITGPVHWHYADFTDISKIVHARNRIAGGRSHPDTMARFTLSVRMISRVFRLSMKEKW